MLKETLELVREDAGRDLPHYTSCVTAAFDSVDPVFTRPQYTNFFWHCASTIRGWLAQVVLRNAEAESEGSAKLVELWQTVSFNSEVEGSVLRHATDEARHARLFVRLAEMVFPGLSTTGALGTVRDSLTTVDQAGLRKSASQIDEPVLIDHLVQMNMGEIRTRVHMELLAPVLNAFAPEERRQKLQGTLNRLADDEIVHIGYIAGILENYCENGDKELIAKLYLARLNDFHRLTIKQTERAVHQFGQGRFPGLLAI